LYQLHNLAHIQLAGILNSYLQLHHLPGKVRALLLQQLLAVFQPTYNYRGAALLLLSLCGVEIFIVIFQMSFDKEYIEMYGKKAVETYKRSLRHSDEPEPPLKPSLEPLKRSESCSRYLSKTKPGSSRSRKASPKVIKNHEKKQGNGHLSTVQLFLQPNKKKLVISDLGTPKETPNKRKAGKKSQRVLNNTNVNVYVQAMNRSKSKESTPCRDKNNVKTTRPKNYCSETLAKVISLLSSTDMRSSEGNALRETNTIRKCL
jgi:hypothetical protein